MARPKSENPTDHELSILKILWNDAPLTVHELLDRFPRDPKPAYSSLLTIVRLMDKKGYLRHQKTGKAFQYFPVLEKSVYSKSQIKNLAEKIFGGSSYDLAVNLLKNEKLKPSEVQKLKKLVEDL